MSSGPAAATPTEGQPVNHGRRVVVAWLVLSVIATPLVAAFVGPLIPPGNMSVQGQGQVFDNQVMTALITPIFCLLLVYFVYSLASFRAPRGSAVVDGPPLREDSQVQVLWIVITTVMVLFLAGFGTYELLKDGSGGGQGPSPISKPSGNVFEVQVIAQQWQFTYRYPSLGGFESQDLMLPADSHVRLDVTSLDAVHSFWAIELGVKADANPGVDNVAYVDTKKAGTTFHVRCAELCGLWHGYMFNNGHVVDQAQLASWAAQQRKIYSSVAKYVQPYSHTYFPDPQRRAG